MITKNAKTTIRIIQLDGLRALAAIGVLYIHCWSSFGNPQIFLFGIDLSKVLAIGGNGVDLFFVISGFIMYCTYGDGVFSAKKFLIKRWIRLSPAFYVASITYISIAYLKSKDFPIFKSTFTSIFYLNNIFTKYNSAALFWTLSLEWQYYLLFPILMFFQKWKNFTMAFLLFSAIFVAFPLIIISFTPSSASLFTEQIIFRFFEFGFGMLAARFFINHRSSRHISISLILPLLIVVYFGRYLISKNILDLFLTYGVFFKWLGFSIMGLGFAALLYWSLYQKWLSKVFRFTGLAYLGKLSYSFYLWHGLAIIFTAKYFASYTSIPVAQVFFTFIFSFILLLPISYASYQYLEKPFLKNY